jgi:hypothetical protein
LTQWDYDRLSSLLAATGTFLTGAAATWEAGQKGDFDVSKMLRQVEDAARELNAAKTLLKRERSKRV